MLHRRLLLSALMLGPCSALARPCGETRVLLVCPAGSVKSAIARELLRRKAQEGGLAVTAYSRGIQPENHISPLLAKRLAADHIDPLAERVRAFQPADLHNADIVVAFDQAAEAPALSKARAWKVAAWNTQYDDAKSDTLANIDRLLVELRSRSC